MIGGVNSSSLQIAIKRKAMNVFFFRTDKVRPFLGRLNEDACFYALYNNQGEKIFTDTDVMVVQKTTQKNKGGLTSAYLEDGTYKKSFYAVIAAPQAVKISSMGESHQRIHHHVNYAADAPCILNERWKK